VTSCLLADPNPHLIHALEEACTYKSAQSHAGDNLASSGKRTRGSDAWNTLVSLCIACAAGNHSRENPAAIFHFLPEDQHRRCDLNLWPFNLEIIEFSGLIVEHLFVKFGDPSCIGVFRYHARNRQRAVENLRAWHRSAWWWWWNVNLYSTSS